MPTLEAVSSLLVSLASSQRILQNAYGGRLRVMLQSAAFLLRFGSSYAENETIGETSAFPLRLDGNPPSLLHAPKSGAK
jgi:hypothetical protein